MSEPTHDPDLAAALDVLRGAPVPLRQPPAAIWKRVRATTASPSRPRFVVAFAAALAVGALAVISTQSLRARRAEVVAQSGTTWQRTGRDALSLQLGHLDVTATRLTTVQTPFASVTATTAQFSLDVSEVRLRVGASTGSVEVHLTDSVRVVRAGEWLEIPPRVEPSAQAVPEALLDTGTGAPKSECGDSAECLERESHGDSLAAQLALFDLATAASRRGDQSQALTAWREYLQRFPAGVLAPEASGALVKTLARSQPRAALDAAQTYHQQFGDEPSAGGVELIRAHLLRDEAGRFDEGCAVYAALVSAPSAAVRSEALFQSAMCRRARGDESGAQSLEGQLRRLAPTSDRVKSMGATP